MKKVILLISFFVLGIVACDNESASSQETVKYNVNGLLDSWVNNHIIPDYTDFTVLTEDLVSAKNTLITDATVDNLVALRSAYFEAYIYFQRIGAYNIGLALDSNYYLYMNAYPTNVNQIESNVLLGMTTDDLNVTSMQNAQGFPAIDYLLNGLADNDTDILEALTVDHLDYLSVVIDNIDILTKLILGDWTNGYDKVFINDSGTAITSSPNLFYDGLIAYFENKIRRQKIDTPAGILNGKPSPEKIESLYDPEKSKGFLLESFKQFQSFYLGNSSDVASLSSVIVEAGRTDLDEAIKDQFAVVESAINTLDDNLKNQIELDNQAVFAFRDSFQSLVVYFKSDVTSVLGFRILTPDSDGD